MVQTALHCLNSIMLGNVRTLLGWAVELLIKVLDWVTSDGWMDTS